jgi:hypothetical protein
LVSKNFQIIDCLKLQIGPYFSNLKVGANFLKFIKMAPNIHNENFYYFIQTHTYLKNEGNSNTIILNRLKF